MKIRRRQEALWQIAFRVEDTAAEQQLRREEQAQRQGSLRATEMAIQSSDMQKFPRKVKLADELWCPAKWRQTFTINVWGVFEIVFVTFYFNYLLVLNTTRLLHLILTLCGERGRSRSE